MIYLVVQILKVLKKQAKKGVHLVIGDEPREKLIFKHKNLNILGFQEHRKVLKILEKTSIAVACSRWQEPFGRTSLEASSRGCAVIISDKGGLKETITDGIIIKKNSADANNYLDLIKNKKRLNIVQKKSYKNFYLTNEYISQKIFASNKILSDRFKKSTHTSIKIQTKDNSYNQF